MKAESRKQKAESRKIERRTQNEEFRMENSLGGGFLLLHSALCALRFRAGRARHGSTGVFNLRRTLPSPVDNVHSFRNGSRRAQPPVARLSIFPCPADARWACS